MSRRDRERFDALLEEVIASLPPALKRLIEEVPVIVDDRPDPELVRSLIREYGEEGGPDAEEEMAQTLCGLHSGVALTERSVSEVPDTPSDVRLYREGILNTAGGWQDDGEEETVYDEIWITLLHELGHHFGLDEDDLAELGYD
ncbi:MAG: metallopeptidase family protein [Phycisphaeraceae bacterium]|nr:MAG: metallopeptidase family protein [Phycisphaeraceae bacterium]